MNKGEYQVEWIQALRDGTLVTFKHDPNSVGTRMNGHRTVLSHEMVAGLEPFFAGGQFNVHEYENTDYPRTPLYIEIEPIDPQFSVPGSGIPAYGATPTTDCDRLVIVSGQRQGLHIYAEKHSEIARRVADGTLIPRSNL